MVYSSHLLFIINAMNYLLLAGALWLYMSAWFVMSLVTKRSDVADIAWGLGFVFIAWLAWSLGASPLDTALYLPLACISVWGVRLALHIFTRNRHKAEDKRYNAWRKEWGKTFVVRSYLQIFLLQGLLLAVIVSPAAVLFLEGRTWSQWTPWIIGLGLVTWIKGFIFESVGDEQLARFLAKPENKGKIMQSGLWKYTRHPNYFGESMMWWGVWLMTFGAAGNIWWLLGISPLTITFLLLFVSGVPMLEAHYKNNAAYQEYAGRTSKFVPWFPGKARKEQI